MWSSGLKLSARFVGCVVLLTVSGCGPMTEFPPSVATTEVSKPRISFSPVITSESPTLPQATVLPLATIVAAPQPVESTYTPVSSELPGEFSAAGVEATRQAGRLEPLLAELAAAHRERDLVRLAALGGNPHVDLAAGTVRVILELDRDPEARPGTSTVEVITTENGQRIEIHHAAPVAIRPELAAAIAGTGAVYETAHENLVQVSAPFGSLEALAALPDVRRVRLPYPAGR